ncbi:MAG: hypothetical protein GMKNLPBB_00994 [Myxococcota bacterium]|nr:hypothetical protein [Myxococcota bacterium]
MDIRVIIGKIVFFITTYLLPIPVFAAIWRRLTRKLVDSFHEAAARPNEVQTEKLLDILKRNSSSTYGMKYDFRSIKSVDDYRAKVPVVRYEDIQPYVDRMCKGESGVLVSEPVNYFACSSGTTGRSKFIPITASFVEEYKNHQKLWFAVFGRSFPGLIRGNWLTIVSNKIEGYTEGGAPYGSISRVLTVRESEIADKLATFPRGCFLIDDFDSKYYAILRIALSNRVSVFSAVNPSTLIMFCKKLNQFRDELIQDVERGTLASWLKIDAPLRRRIESKLKPDPRRARRLRQLVEKNGELRPKDVWPELCGLACWKGGSAGFYLRQFPRWFGDLPQLEFGFLATEGAFSTPLSTEGAKGVVAIRSHFYEFVPADIRDANPGDPHPPTLLAGDLETGKEYYVILTASNGLYRYDINDIVRVVGECGATPEIEFVHKGGNMLSITGEKVGESHVVRAVTAAAESAGVRLHGFSVSIRLDEIPRYVFAVEPDGAPSRELLEKLLRGCDLQLKQVNMEYETKRDSGRLGEPLLLTLEQHAFEAHRKRRVAAGAPDAHIKHPYLFREEKLLREALAVTGEVP